MAHIWSTANNITLSTLNETEQINVPLPINPGVQIDSVIKLAGQLPPGLRLDGNNLIGSPFEVERDTEFRFVLRATATINGQQLLEDRTLNIIITGPDDPVWVTNEGLLPVGPSGAFFVLDNEPIYLQLQAIDPDIPAGDALEYFIAPGDGELPEGIKLSKEGILYGTTDAIISLEKSDNSGHFDSNNYDSNAFDFGIRSANGFDSFSYDSGFFDDAILTRPPKKLNRYFEFIVSVSDGETVVKRTFRIFLVGDDFLRTDNTIMQIGTGVFTADNTYLRTPIWITNSSLGEKRANNYITLPLEVLDSNQIVGRLFYSLENTNPGRYQFSDGSIVDGYFELSNIFPRHPDGYTTITANNIEIGKSYYIVSTYSGQNVTDFTTIGATDNNFGTIFRATGVGTGLGTVYEINFTSLIEETDSKFPEGMLLDTANGVVAGQVPYQPEVTQDFKFTIKATRFAAETELVTVYATLYEDILAGQRTIKINKLNTLLDDGVNDLLAFRGQYLDFAGQSYQVQATQSIDPIFDEFILDRALQPKVPLTVFQNAQIGENFVRINPIQQKNQIELTGKIFNYPNGEIYTITDFVPYIEWTIKNVSGSGGIVTIPAVGNPTDPVLQQITDVFNDIYDQALGPLEAIQINNEHFVVRLPATSLTTNTQYVIGRFSNAQDLSVSVTARYDVMNLQQSLQRVLFKDSVFGITEYKNYTIQKTIPIVDRDLQTQYSSNNPPQDPLIGQLWFNTGNAFYNLDVLHEWDGNVWQPVTFDSINSPNAIRTFDLRILGEIDSEIKWITDSNLATIDANYQSLLFIRAESAVESDVIVYEIKSGALPPGLTLDLSGEIIGKVVQFGENKYTGFWVPGRQYNLNDVIDFEGTRYISLQDHLSNPQGLGQYVERNYVRDGYVGFDKLLAFDADSIYWQPYQFSKTGLTLFDSGNLKFDGETTSIDRVYKFVATARDRFSVSTVEKEFSIQVSDPGDNLYSNLYVKPFLTQSKKDSLIQFLGDPTIFPPISLYRPNDPNFGIQKDLKMLVYSGIKQQEIVNFVSASAKNHLRSRYSFGDIKKAEAKIQGTNEVLYEVVYIEIIDARKPKEGSIQTVFNAPSGKRITVDSISYSVQDDVTKTGSGYPEIQILTRTGTTYSDVTDQIELLLRDGSVVGTDYEGTLQVTLYNGSIVNVEVNQSDSEPYRIRPATNTIKVDTNAIKVSQNNNYVRYISSIENMRNRIQETGETNNDFLPLWMQTAQNNIQALGYVTGVPICYCKPGQADRILLNIKNSDFDFKQFDFDIDRYIIDSTVGNSNEQYILFANYEFNI